eukprot:gnl/Ergobibamus_cyprinoides/3968.p1 GENE.gnl/Ergobibamus_cyprinoides/3968~~gnl/Ergobibamus_cyprinoides/3968.p1  ORF type:complete len:182 (-),score=43.23 gnl/Ergobibamus_cyprinoides/3968:14-559(-)
MQNLPALVELQRQEDKLIPDLPDNYYEIGMLVLSDLTTPEFLFDTFDTVYNAFRTMLQLRVLRIITMMRSLKADDFLVNAFVRLPHLRSVENRLVASSLGPYSADIHNDLESVFARELKWDVSQPFEDVPAFPASASALGPSPSPFAAASQSRAASPSDVSSSGALSSADRRFSSAARRPT